MALLRDRVYKRLPTLFTLIKLEAAKINLKPLNKLTVRFDPFKENVADIRKFTSLLYQADIVKTNTKCRIITEILTDRSEPTVTFDLTDGKQFIFKCKNLKCLEIFQLMNEHITPLAPKEEEVQEFKEVKKKMTKRK